MNNPKPKKALVWDPPEKVEPPPDDHGDEEDDAAALGVLDLPPLESDDKPSVPKTVDNVNQSPPKSPNNNLPVEMSLILPNLFVGSLDNAKNEKELTTFQISHVVSLYKDAAPLDKTRTFLCISAVDNSLQNIRQHIPVVNDFIHEHRKKGNVLVHCTSGTSCSAALVIAYIMTVTDCPFRKALNFVKNRRPATQPNIGFTLQLQKFEVETLPSEKLRFRAKYPKESDKFNDGTECEKILEKPNKAVAAASPAKTTS